MERIVFAESWKEYFGGVGLGSFGDFYDYPGGTKIGKNDRRNVYELTFGEGADAKVFYIKRFHNSHLKDMFGAWCNFGRLTSQAGVEWGNANLLLENGIDTYKPVCMGERTIWGLERKSFVITERLEAMCLQDFVITKWHALDRSQQDKIIAAMAQLARKAHEANISLQDLYIWHIFLDEESLAGDCSMSVIDLHRMLRNVKDPDKKITDMGALYWSMSSDYFDAEHKALLIAAYVGDGGVGDKESISEKILKRADILGSRRILHNHYEKAKRGLGLD